MPWQHHIMLDPHVLVGKPLIKGTRIAVEFVIDLLRAVGQLSKSWPSTIT